MKNKYYNIPILFVLLTAACENRPSGSALETPLQLEDAWATYELNAYEAGLQKFQELIITQDNPSDAYVGAGWCAMRLKLYSQAEVYFSRGEREDPLNLDASAGNAIAKWTVGGYSFDYPSQTFEANVFLAISKAQKVLTAAPTYSFQYDSNVDYRDLIWVQAAGYWEVGDFSNCLASIKKLDPAFNADAGAPDIAITLLNKLTALGAAS